MPASTTIAPPETQPNAEAAAPADIASFLDIPDGMMPETERAEEDEEPAAAAAAEAPEGTDVPTKAAPADGGAEEDEEPIDPRTAGAVEAMQKRIDAVTAKRREAERVAEELRTELEALKGKPVKAEPATAPAGTVPLAHVQDEAGIAKEIERAEGVIAWARANWDGVDKDGVPVKVKMADGSDREVDAQEVREASWRAEDALRRHIPARRAFIAAKTRAATDAKTHFPEMFDPNTEAGQEYARRARQFDGVMRQYAEGPMLIALALKGMGVLQGEIAARREKAEKPTDTNPELAPPSPASRGTVPKAPARRSRQEDALQEMQANPTDSVEALTRYFGGGA